MKNLLTMTFAVALVLVVSATGLWAGGSTEEEPAAAMETEMVEEAGPEYGGTITMMDAYLGRFPPTEWDPAEFVWPLMVYVEHFEQLLGGDWQNRGPRGTNEWPFNVRSGPPNDFLSGVLAESWSTPDATTVIFNIRRGVMWHEAPGVMASRELTAEDVAYHWTRTLASDKAWTIYDAVESVTATDEYTVEFKLASYTPDWMLLIGRGHLPTWIASPPELVEAGPSDWRNHRGVGTGPFLLDDFVEGTSVSYVRNDNYWQTETIDGKEYEIPFIDRLVKILTPDRAAQIAALRTGRLDQLNVVGAQYVQSLQNTNPEIKLIGRPAGGSYLIGMRLDTAPFDDPKVRKAMSMAIDRQGFIANIWGGAGEILNFPAPSNLPETVYTPLEKLPESIREQLEYNPERARQLLAEAGLADGFEATLQGYAIEPWEDIASLLVAFWADIGVDVSIDLIEKTTMDAMFTAKEHGPLSMFTVGGGVDALGVIQGRYIEPLIYNTPMFEHHPEYAEIRERWQQAYDTRDLVEKYKLTKELNQEALSTVAFALLPTPYVYLGIWPWVENHYGELAPAAGTGGVGPVMSRVWINSALKQELVGGQ